MSTGTAPLEFLVVGVARDMHKKNDLLATPPQRLGGPAAAVPAARGAAAACRRHDEPDT